MNYATITDANIFSRSLLPWQKLGLRETATGYGDKLTTPYKVRYKGYNRRIYCVCHSNNGSLYVMVKGVKEYLRDCDVPSCSEIQKERFGDVEWEMSYLAEGLYQWVSGAYLIRQRLRGDGYDLFLYDSLSDNFDSLWEAKEFAEELLIHH